MERGKKCQGREAGIGGAFGLVDAINSYARQRGSLLPEIRD